VLAPEPDTGVSAGTFCRSEIRLFWRQQIERVSPEDLIAAGMTKAILDTFPQTRRQASGPR
jgi:hypothetical protein